MHPDTSGHCLLNRGKHVKTHNKMVTSTTKIRVRYAETDQMGYVYYGNYAMYYEVARVEALRQMGFAYKKLEKMGIMMPVIDLKNRFIKPGMYDELLTIKVTIPEMPAVKMRFTYEITNEDHELINIGETTLFFANTKTGKPVRIPELMKELFEPFFK